MLEVSNAMTQACTDKVFMLVGQGWALDAGQEKTSASAVSSPRCRRIGVDGVRARARAWCSRWPTPAISATLCFGYQMAAAFPDAVKKTAFVFANYSATHREQGQARPRFRRRASTSSTAISEYNIGGESDWKPFANNLKACGAEVVYWVGVARTRTSRTSSPRPSRSAIAPSWIADANSYDASFAKWNGENGGAADNVYVRMAFVPVRGGRQVAGHAEVPRDRRQVQAARSACSARRPRRTSCCGPRVSRRAARPVTPKCVIAEIGKLKDWTAGGLHVPTNPGENRRRPAASC